MWPPRGDRGGHRVGQDRRRPHGDRRCHIEACSRWSSCRRGAHGTVVRTPRRHARCRDRTRGDGYATADRPRRPHHHPPPSRQPSTTDLGPRWHPVADECHGFGGPVLRKSLLPEYQERLGLTATLERLDDAGETILLLYFGGIAATATSPRRSPTAWRPAPSASWRYRSPARSAPNTTPPRVVSSPPADSSNRSRASPTSRSATSLPPSITSPPTTPALTAAAERHHHSRLVVRSWRPVRRVRRSRQVRRGDRIADGALSTPTVRCEPRDRPSRSGQPYRSSRRHRPQRPWRHPRTAARRALDAVAPRAPDRGSTFNANLGLLSGEPHPPPDDPAVGRILPQPLGSGALSSSLPPDAEILFLRGSTVSGGDRGDRRVVSHLQAERVRSLATFLTTPGLRCSHSLETVGSFAAGSGGGDHEWPPPYLEMISPNFSRSPPTGAEQFRLSTGEHPVAVGSQWALQHQATSAPRTHKQAMDTRSSVPACADQSAATDAWHRHPSHQPHRRGFAGDRRRSAAAMLLRTATKYAMGDRVHMVALGNATVEMTVLE